MKDNSSNLARYNFTAINMYICSTDPQNMLNPNNLVGTVFVLP